MGANDSGQLGLGSKKAMPTFVQVPALAGAKIAKVAAGHHTAALSDQGELFLWGTGVFGEVLVPQRVSNVDAKIKEVSVGGAFGAALDVNGKVWTWGANTSGELGVGDYEPRTQPFYLARLQNKTVVRISCGGAFALALGVTHNVPVPRVVPTAALQDELAQQKLLTAQFGATLPEPVPLAEEDKAVEIEDVEGDQGKRFQSDTHSDVVDLEAVKEFQNRYDYTPSASDLNGAEGSSSMSQRDPNQHVLREI